MSEWSQDDIEKAVVRYKMSWPERKALLVKKLCDPGVDPASFTGHEAIDYRKLLDEENGIITDDLTHKLFDLNELMKAFGSNGLLDVLGQCNLELMKDMNCD